MSEQHSKIERKSGGGFLRKLARDRSGNTLALIAAAIFPLLGLVGSGIDMGRAYLSSSRLQQACDAGVLAARKRLGTEAAVSGTIPTDVAATGQRFFNLNFRDGSYGTEDRQFTMTLEEDFSISGSAQVDVPTSIMGVFGFEEVPVSVNCQAMLSAGALDVMMVLDVTGSMRHTNAGDSATRMESLKAVIRNFHAQLEAAKAPNSEVRYGFVPYATNVNVGHLLEDSWVANSWTYQSREDMGTSATGGSTSSYSNYQYVSGTQSGWTEISTFPATFVPPSGADTSGYYSCISPTPIPPSTYAVTYTVDSTETIGGITIEHRTQVINGTSYSIWSSGSTCTLKSSTYDNFTQTYDYSVSPTVSTLWKYKPLTFDMSDWRTETDGCIEERATVEITDYTNVDFSQALDLDIDLVPTAGNANTQWKPQNPSEIYVRAITPYETGTFSLPEVETTSDYADTGNWWFSDCPAQAQKLDVMTTEELDTYLATLAPYGATYHDIGMIWGARLISPTGLFASENADTGATTRGRHLIFLTDGQTEPYDLAYGAYGVEGLDQRRWNPSSATTLVDTIESRFAVACAEAKKRNVTVWVIAFGTYLNASMVECAGPGHYFEAASATELSDAFSAISKSMGDLRITE